MNSERADPDTDGVPSPDDSPIPAGTAVLTPDTYENRLGRTTTARGEIRVVVLVNSAERAETLRHALSEPEVPGGIGSWEVVDGPDADTVVAALTDPNVDITYCGLPIDNGRIVAADGSVSLDGPSEAPALAVFEGVTDSALGVSVVENGGLSSILTETTIDPNSFRSLIGLLSSGISIAPSVGLSGIESATRTRIVGDPGIEVASDSNLSTQVSRIVSESPTVHHAKRGSVLSLSARIGLEQKQFFDAYHSKDELAGRMWIDGPTLDCSDVLALSEEGDSVVHLNGRLLLPEDVETESDIEESARRYLSEDSAPPDCARECRPE